MTEKPEPLLEAKIASLLGNLKEPKTITAEYVITTPMFIGDANQDATRISAASVKGALRFWWRAYKWSDVLSNNQGNEANALTELHHLEAELFGSSSYTTEHKYKGKTHPPLGKGKFSLRVEPAIDLQQLSKSTLNQGTRENPYRLQRNSWITYLLGLGLYMNEYTRPALKPNQVFNVVCAYEDPEVEKELEKVLILWGVLGGLGSRSRKGLGSVSI